MGVRAAEPERVHPAVERVVRTVRLPRNRGGRHPEAVIGERDVRIRAPEVDVRRHGAVMKGQRELDQPPDARGRFEVPEVRLHGPDPQRSVGRPTDPEHRPIADASIGSPTGVPVPCASTNPTRSAGTRARRYASSSMARCWSPLGTVSPPVRPSWFVTVARIAA